jgi:hypothetical protein
VSTIEYCFGFDIIFIMDKSRWSGRRTSSDGNGTGPDLFFQGVNQRDRKQKLEDLKVSPRLQKSVLTNLVPPRTPPSEEV